MQILTYKIFFKISIAITCCIFHFFLFLRIPQALYHFGALSYSEELMKYLKAGKIFHINMYFQRGIGPFPIILPKPMFEGKFLLLKIDIGTCRNIFVLVL